MWCAPFGFPTLTNKVVVSIRIQAVMSHFATKSEDIGQKVIDTSKIVHAWITMLTQRTSCTFLSGSNFFVQDNFHPVCQEAVQSHHYWCCHDTWEEKMFQVVTEADPLLWQLVDTRARWLHTEISPLWMVGSKFIQGCSNWESAWHGFIDYYYMSLNRQLIPTKVIYK